MRRRTKHMKRATASGRTSTDVARRRRASSSTRTTCAACVSTITCHDAPVHEYGPKIVNAFGSPGMLTPS